MHTYINTDRRVCTHTHNRYNMDYDKIPHMTKKVHSSPHNLTIGTIKFVLTEDQTNIMPFQHALDC